MGSDVVDPIKKNVTDPIKNKVKDTYDSIEDEAKRGIRQGKQQVEEAVGFELEVGKEDLFVPGYNIGKNSSISLAKAAIKEAGNIFSEISGKDGESVEAAKIIEGGNNVVDPTADNVTDEVSKDTQLANEAMVQRSRSASSVGGSRTGNLLAGEGRNLEEDEDISVRTLLGY